MRVNARFEGTAERQVEYLATATGMKVSDVLRESVDFYYRHVRSGNGQLKHLTKLIGQGDSGLSDVSSNVKKYLTEGLDEKYAPTGQATERAVKRPALKSARRKPGPTE